MKKILIMAGGTGGHVFPALAVAEELKSQNIEVHWLGTPRGIENTLIPEAGYPLHHIRVKGLVGSGLTRKLMMPFMLIRAAFQGVWVILKVKPNVVLGMGGFAAGPGGIAAYLMAKPIIVHEQNAVAGMTNSHLSKLAKVVLTGFRDVKNLAKKPVWVGNPVRAEISEKRLNERPVIDDQQVIVEARKVLILGGSQGARSLNEELPEMLTKLAEKLKISVWHQTGKGRNEAVEQAYSTLLSKDVDVNVEEFIDDMATAYQWPDLIICRAGAMTVSEIMAAGKAAIFLPYPYAAGDHQTLNAQFMVDAGASLLSKDSDIASDAFYQDVLGLLQRPQVLKKMGEAASLMHRPNAAKNTADHCMELMRA